MAVIRKAILICFHSLLNNTRSLASISASQNHSPFIYMFQEKIKSFLEMRDRGELLVQKARKLFCNLLKEVALAVPSEYVKFGDVVQLVAPDMPRKCRGTEGELGVALSGLVGEKEVDSIQHYVEGSVMSGSSHLTPCVRNSFVIRSGDCLKRDGEPLKFGQDFNLCPVVNLSGHELYVQSEVRRLDSQVGPSGYPELSLTSHRNTYCRWRALCWDPLQRPETEGSPVPPNCRLVINHAPSNRNMAVEHQHWFQTYFGMECQVAVHTYKDVHRRETSENVWMLVTQKPKDLNATVQA
ncbi:cilia- and flagella-associated protein 161-like isoform X2 [Zootermopsis nevadensis]|uniref:cilia- and flagella-associated protein 161-like isoform X2 n=1 Tax=Zootermopsis nevadensis TaxID=136037 RepID=UPI000B8EBDC7|nr:cilia- and flagella-associated protein 161-like isoform X2 [Zootermopsis nevadensis]